MTQALETPAADEPSNPVPEDRAGDGGDREDGVRPTPVDLDESMAENFRAVFNPRP